MASRPHWGWQKPPAVSRPLPLQPRQFNVSFYRTPPGGFESLNNMLLLAEERLNLFRILQKLGSEQPHLENVSLGVLLDTGENSEIKEARYKDNASHWILRIAYAQRPELHQLFVKLERLWFDLKWQRLSDEDKSEFLNEEVDLPLVSLPDSPQERLYKIKWTQAPGMVATREFRLKDGFLFFPKSARINYVTEWFQQYLNEALTVTEIKSLESDSIIQSVTKRTAGLWKRLELHSSEINSLQ